MPKKMTPEERAEYMRTYREKQKVTKQEVDEILDQAVSEGVMDQHARDSIVVLDEKQSVALETAIRSDRQRGLPRTNYDSDHKAKGGWTEVIQKLDGKAIDRILNHPAIKTKR